VKKQGTGIREQGTGNEEAMNARRILPGVLVMLLLALARSLRAQSGCDDSPEDPTLALALVAGAGAVAASFFLRRRLGR
jgi:XrtJ-associated TM-motif-TM protein